MPGRFASSWLLRGNRQARGFVGTSPASGIVQMRILRLEALVRESRVLEIGCGALHLALPLIDFLDRGKYVGIDPNEWLRQQPLERRPTRRLVREKGAVFLSGDDFDSTELARQFDFVFAHSVLSHAAHWQLGQFLTNTVKVLSPDGRIVASIRLAEGNEYGSSGAPDGVDSMDEAWVYPDVSYFSESTLRKAATDAGLDVRVEPSYTEMYVAERPDEYHDWLV
ncbi:MAG: class I SAM-dependent methyltransferase, partial [Acidobacteriota bacterium]|nr:class I SAM-dependent methyltransferase [Acidobacteriota bacterium]